MYGVVCYNGIQAAARRYVLYGSSSWTAISNIYQEFSPIFKVCFIYQRINTNS